jgi:anion-transporting  ArsA/GET3 family ATPase
MTNPSPPYPLDAHARGMPAHILARQVHVVMGKGGVGKSTVALALALGLHARGKRVLLCQVNTPDAHGPLLGLQVDAELRDARRGLTVVDIEPQSARREYVMMILKFRTVYDTVFENRLVQYFLRFIPSLAELNITGKIWFHAEERAGDAPRFDHIVVDAPATGHGITLMKVARVLSQTAPPGPLRSQTEDMARLFEDPRRTALHVVTTPDELSVLETTELLARIRRERVGPLGCAVVNRVPAPLFGGRGVAPWEALAQNPQLAPLARVVTERAQLEAASVTAVERLGAPDLPVVVLPEAPSRAFSLADVETFSAALLRAPRVVEAL